MIYRDKDGEPVTAEDVLTPDELVKYYEQKVGEKPHRWDLREKLRKLKKSLTPMDRKNP